MLAKTTLPTNLNSDQIGILYSKLRGNCISMDTDFTTFKNAINGCPMSAMENKKVKWTARVNVLNCLLFGFGSPKQIGEKIYSFEGICTMKHNRAGLIINQVFDVVEKKGSGYITAGIKALRGQGQIHGLNKLLPAIEYLNKQVYDKYNTPIHKQVIEINNEIERKEVNEEKEVQLKPCTEEIDLNTIMLQEILSRVIKVETFLKLEKGINLNQAANYLDVDMNEIYRLIAFGNIKMDQDKMVNLDDLIKYKTTLE